LFTTFTLHTVLPHILGLYTFTHILPHTFTHTTFGCWFTFALRTLRTLVYYTHRWLRLHHTLRTFLVPGFGFTRTHTVVRFAHGYAPLVWFDVYILHTHTTHPWFYTAGLHTTVPPGLRYVWFSLHTTSLHTHITRFTHTFTRLHTFGLHYTHGSRLGWLVGLVPLHTGLRLVYTRRFTHAVGLHWTVCCVCGLHTTRTHTATHCTAPARYARHLRFTHAHTRTHALYVYRTRHTPTLFTTRTPFPRLVFARYPRTVHTVLVRFGTVGLQLRLVHLRVYYGYTRTRVALPHCVTHTRLVLVPHTTHAHWFTVAPHMVYTHTHITHTHTFYTLGHTVGGAQVQFTHAHALPRFTHTLLRATHTQVGLVTRYARFAVYGSHRSRLPWFTQRLRCSHHHTTHTHTGSHPTHTPWFGPHTVYPHTHTGLHTVYITTFGLRTFGLPRTGCTLHAPAARTHLHTAFTSLRDCRTGLHLPRPLTSVFHATHALPHARCRASHTFGAHCLPTFACCLYWFTAFYAHCRTTHTHRFGLVWVGWVYYTRTFAFTVFPHTHAHHTRTFARFCCVRTRFRTAVWFGRHTYTHLRVCVSAHGFTVYATRFTGLVYAHHAGCVLRFLHHLTLRFWFVWFAGLVLLRFTHTHGSGLHTFWLGSHFGWLHTHVWTTHTLPHATFTHTFTLLPLPVAPLRLLSLHTPHTHWLHTHFTDPGLVEHLGHTVHIWFTQPHTFYLSFVQHTLFGFRFTHTPHLVHTFPLPTGYTRSWFGLHRTTHPTGTLQFWLHRALAPFAAHTWFAARHRCCCAPHAHARLPRARFTHAHVGCPYGSHTATLHHTRTHYPHCPAHTPQVCLPRTAAHYAAPRARCRTLPTAAHTHAHTTTAHGLLAAPRFTTLPFRVYRTPHTFILFYAHTRCGLVFFHTPHTHTVYLHTTGLHTFGLFADTPGYTHTVCWFTGYWLRLRFGYTHLLRLRLRGSLRTTRTGLLGQAPHTGCPHTGSCTHVWFTQYTVHTRSHTHTGCLPHTHTFYTLWRRLHTGLHTHHTHVCSHTVFTHTRSYVRSFYLHTRWVGYYTARFTVCYHHTTLHTRWVCLRILHTHTYCTHTHARFPHTLVCHHTSRLPHVTVYVTHTQRTQVYTRYSLHGYTRVCTVGFTVVWFLPHHTHLGWCPHTRFTTGSPHTHTPHTHWFGLVYTHTATHTLRTRLVPHTHVLLHTRFTFTLVYVCGSVCLCTYALHFPFHTLHAHYLRFTTCRCAPFHAGYRLHTHTVLRVLRFTPHWLDALLRTRTCCTARTAPHRVTHLPHYTTLVCGLQVYRAGWVYPLVPLPTVHTRAHALLHATYTHLHTLLVCTHAHTPLPRTTLVHSCRFAYRFGYRFTFTTHTPHTHTHTRCLVWWFTLHFTHTFVPPTHCLVRTHHTPPTHSLPHFPHTRTRLRFTHGLPHHTHTHTHWFTPVYLVTHLHVCYVPRFTVYVYTVYTALTFTRLSVYVYFTLLFVQLVGWHTFIWITFYPTPHCPGWFSSRLQLFTRVPHYTHGWLVYFSHVGLRFTVQFTFSLVALLVTVNGSHTPFYGFGHGCLHHTGSHGSHTPCVPTHVHTTLQNTHTFYTPRFTPTPHTPQHLPFWLHTHILHTHVHTAFYFYTHTHTVYTFWVWFV